MPSTASHDLDNTSPDVVEHVSLENLVSTRVASGRCHVSYSRIVGRAMLETDPLLLEADTLGFRPWATGTCCGKRERERERGRRLTDLWACNRTRREPRFPSNDSSISIKKLRFDGSYSFKFVLDSVHSCFFDGWSVSGGASENASSIRAGAGNWRVALLIWVRNLVFCGFGSRDLLDAELWRMMNDVFNFGKVVKKELRKPNLWEKRLWSCPVLFLLSLGSNDLIA